MAAKRPRAKGKAGVEKPTRRPRSAPFRPTHPNWDPLMGQSPTGGAFGLRVRRFQRAIDEGERIREWEAFADAVHTDHAGIGATGGKRSADSRRRRHGIIVQKALTLFLEERDRTADAAGLAKALWFKLDKQSADHKALRTAYDTLPSLRTVLRDVYDWLDAARDRIHAAFPPLNVPATTDAAIKRRDEEARRHLRIGEAAHLIVEERFNTERPRYAGPGRPPERIPWLTSAARQSFVVKLDALLIR